MWFPDVSRAAAHSELPRRSSPAPAHVAEATDRLLLALQCAASASLRSLVQASSALAAAVIVTARQQDRREVPIVKSFLAADDQADAEHRPSWQTALDELTAGPAHTELSQLIARLATLPAFAAMGPEAVTIVRRPPLSAIVLVSARQEGRAGSAAMSALLTCSRQTQAALGNFLMCREGAAAGHDLAFLGASEAFLQLEEHTRAVASHSDIPVLIHGERGSGKEAVAYALHYYSARRKGPFVVVNAAALQPELYASELFGCRRGSYTGAVEDRAGRFEAAEGGTLFFDEITEMPPQLYAGLLRAFDHGEIQKLGDNRARRINTRIIAATNRNLELLAREGRFPADLYDRISALRVSVPPLRERRTDIPLLASFYLKRFCLPADGRHDAGERICEQCRLSDRPLCLAADVLPALGRHDWPGNVRELKNVVLRLRAMSTDGRIAARDLSPVLGTTFPSSGAPTEGADEDQTLDGMLRRHILVTLRRAGWNKSAAARLLDIPLSTLVSKMKRLHVPQRPTPLMDASCDGAQATLRSSATRAAVGGAMRVGGR